ncbi:hypothetical protein QFC24_004574 [Naganishia onofrii]|uniref:Uncharacterized protein n=1 Tax=Naganishia onofrii TaxID=1851511 RepID=A0ACC2XG28_9TREE|nr:hypothetical protein QFC24_004574 [Naganishia onofrii]
MTNVHPEPTAATVVEEPRKPRLVLVSAPAATTTTITAATTPMKRVVDSPPHQSRTAVTTVPPPPAPSTTTTASSLQIEKPDSKSQADAVLAVAKQVETVKLPPLTGEPETKLETVVSGEPSVPPTTQQPSATATPPATAPRGRSRSPIKISLPSMTLGVKKAGNTPTAASGFPVDTPREREAVSGVSDTRGRAGDESITRQAKGSDGDARLLSDTMPSVPPPSSRPPTSESRQASPPFPSGMSFSVRERERERRERYDDSRYASRYPTRGAGSGGRARGRPTRGRGGYGAPYERYGQSSSSMAGSLAERDGRLIASSSYTGGLTASVSGSTAGSVPRGVYIPTGPSGGFGRGRGRGGPPIAPRAPRAERLGYAVAGVPPTGPARPTGVSSVVVQPVVPDSGAVQDSALGGLSQPPSAGSVSTAPPLPTQQPEMVQESPVATIRTEFVDRPMSQDISTVVAPTGVVAPMPTTVAESTAELMTDRESKIKIQLKHDTEVSTAAVSSMAPPERPTIKQNAALVAPPHKFSASSPVAPALSTSSPATPLVDGKISASPMIGSSPIDTGAMTPGKAQMDRRTEARPMQHPPAPTPIRRPSHITLPPPSNVTPQPRSRASSSAVPPTPGVRTPHPQQPGPQSLLRHSTSYARPAPVWKEYSPPAELHIRDRPTVADVMDALHAVLPSSLGMNEDYAARRGGGLADRDMTRVAGEWERQLARLQHERALVTHAFQSIASGLRIRKFEMGNALDEVWVAERKVEAAGMTMETAVFSPKRE